MRSLRKMLRLRRQRREAESQRFMTELCRWFESARRFDQSPEPAGLPIGGLNSMPPVPNSPTSDDPA